MLAELFTDCFTPDVVAPSVASAVLKVKTRRTAADKAQKALRDIARVLQVGGASVEDLAISAHESDPSRKIVNEGERMLIQISKAKGLTVPSKHDDARAAEIAIEHAANAAGRKLVMANLAHHLRQKESDVNAHNKKMDAETASLRVRAFGFIAPKRKGEWPKRWQRLWSRIQQNNKNKIKSPIYKLVEATSQDCYKEQQEKETKEEEGAARAKKAQPTKKTKPKKKPVDKKKKMTKKQREAAERRTKEEAEEEDRQEKEEEEEAAQKVAEEVAEAVPLLFTSVAGSSSSSDDDDDDGGEGDDDGDEYDPDEDGCAKKKKQTKRERRSRPTKRIKLTHADLLKRVDEVL